MGRHDDLEEEIIEHLKRPYDELHTNWQFHNRYSAGDIDVLVRRGARYVAYEVKSNFTQKSWDKGKQQLNKIRDYFREEYGARCDLVYFSPQYVKRIK